MLDVVRGQWGADTVEETIRATAELDREDYGRCPVLIESQPAAAGKQWNERWVRDVLFGFDVRMIPPQGSKEFRTDGYSSTQRRGMVYLVRAGWNDVWVTEHAQFKFKAGKPLHRHDDQVDTGSQAFNWLTGKGRTTTASSSSAAGRRIG